MARDGRPKWLLRKLARISSLRRARHRGSLEKLGAAVWWQQIEAAAAELQLQTRWEDWQAWPVEDNLP